MDQPRLMTPEQAARLLSLKRRALIEAAAEGIVPCVRIGRCVLFDRETLPAWIKSGGKGSWRRERA